MNLNQRKSATLQEKLLVCSSIILPWNEVVSDRQTAILNDSVFVKNGASVDASL